MGMSHPLLLYLLVFPKYRTEPPFSISLLYLSVFCVGEAPGEYYGKYVVSGTQGTMHTH